MKDRLSIPKGIKVGFQKRQDTYTGKLAFVISTGKKEDPKSWVNWRDKAINPEEYKNEPTTGFVLNRDVGGTQRSWSWNARREKVRVYDPRDFEFEITVENVLLILQECSSIKGKGLEGEFIYAWSGQQLVLLPVCSQEYKNSVEFIELGAKKVPAKDVVAGCTYINKDRQEVMYLGKFAWCDYGYDSSGRGYNYMMKLGKKQHVFLNLNSKSTGKDRYWLQTGFTKLATRVSEKPIPQFADEYEALMNSRFVSKPVELVIEDTKIDLHEDKNGWYRSPKIAIRDGKKLRVGTLARNTWTYPSDPAKPVSWQVDCQYVAEIKDGAYVETYDRDNSRNKYIDEAEVKTLIKDVYVKFENGAKYRIGD